MTDTQIAWLSKGLEVLLAKKANEPQFDVVIIGSGYGGAIAAARLAGTKDKHGKSLSIAVLERGKEYLPGMFPSGLSTLAGHTRVSGPMKNKVVGNRDGLFDIRAGGDINALIANGLGGGSLINAGVMEQPRPDVFDERWPKRLRGGRALARFYPIVTAKLGASRGGQPNTIERHAQVQARPLHKFVSLQKLGGDNCRAAAITVAMQDGPNNSHVAMNRCALCGDCATGCNFGAKESLDVNLLVEANRRGVKLITGATVLSLAGGDKDGWTIKVIHTDPKLAERADEAVHIRASKVILAAGTFGSTEILARSRQRGLCVSDQLGQRFSGNGDMLAVGFEQNRSVNAVANETTAYGSRHIGPTITGIIDLPEVRGSCNKTKDRPPMVIEEMAVPGAMRRIFEEIFTTVDALQKAIITDCSTHTAGNPDKDPLAVDACAIQSSSIYAVMGNDGAAGSMALRDDFDSVSDGAITVSWPKLGDHPLFPGQIKALETLAASSGSGGRVIANPLWRPLPDSMRVLFDVPKGPLLTVHPLGGCAMADDATTGVVDHLGRVFTGSRVKPKNVYRTLAVLDGSIIPSALEINPALTIAVVATRAVEHLIRICGLQEADLDANPDVSERPVYREISPTADIAPIKPTTMEFAERLCGPIFLDTGSGNIQPYQAEITLHFEDKPLHELYATDDPTRKLHTLKVATRPAPTDKSSQLRLFAQSDWDDVRAQGLTGRVKEEALEQLSVLTAPLAGTLTIMGRERSWLLQRVGRAFWAWCSNRGIRDIWQALFPLAHEKPARKKTVQGSRFARIWRSFKSCCRGLFEFLRKIRYLFSELSHGGEVRLFEYNLTLGAPVTDHLDLIKSTNSTIQGTKRISYRRRSNPLDQLSRITLTTFPHLAPRHRPSELALVPEFLARQGLPLFRIKDEHDGLQGIADLLSLSLYFARLLISTHLLSFRKPDPAKPRVANRLPGDLPGLPAAERREIPILQSAGNTAANVEHILLTRYRGKNEASPPVMLIHGYSASGTTFAHPSLDSDLARHLWHRERDVWILDMRSSCGAKTATVNYTFEQLAATDIPVAVAHICKTTGCKAIDIVAHCMGAAMFSMAVLDPQSLAAGFLYQNERRLLPTRVRRAVLSQVGPLVSMAPANVFRAYLFSYLKYWLPLEHYSFLPPPGGAVLDRLLAAMPYPDEEFDLENPLTPWKRTPWTTARHRMDLLYGRTFALANMSEAALAHIDDFFGPLSVETATQVAHFAKFQSITNDGGVNNYVSRARLRRNWCFPTLSLHGRDNGLADVATVQRMATILADAGCDFRKQVFDGLGHQDGFIGRESLPVFEAIDGFLAGPGRGDPSVCCTEDDPLLVQVPWSGPVIGPLQPCGTLPVSFGCNPGLSKPRLVVAIPLSKRPSGLQLIIDASRNPLCRVYAAPPFVDGWAKMLLPLPDSTCAIHSVLLLLAYDETPELDNALFGAGDPVIDPVSLNDINWTAALSEAEELLAPGAARPDRLAALAFAVEQCVCSSSADLQAGIVRVPHSREGDRLHFALASCQYPPGILDQKPGFDAYRRLATHIKDSDDKAEPVDLLLLVGDQVYVDATAGLADPKASDERYLQPYQNLYRSRDARKALREVPTYMMLDDHEIADNWEPLRYLDRDNDTALDVGRKHYLNFQRGPHQPERDNALWYAFEQNGFHFFVADTRTARQSRDATNVGTRSILGEQQTEDLDKWLAARKDEDPMRPKFIVSSAMLAPRLRQAIKKNEPASALHSDGWEGYPDSLNHLLREVGTHRLHNLVFLSGDAHLSCVATLTLQNETACLPLWSVHSSALFAPYPFANSQRDEFMTQEQIDLVDAQGNKIAVCQVDTEFAPSGDGFAFLKVQKEDGAWRVEVSFARKDVVSTPIVLQQTPPLYGY